MLDRLKQLFQLQQAANQDNQSLLTNKNTQATNGLLSNLTSNPNLLIGAGIIGQGVQGKDPFGAVIPAVTQTAQIQKLLTPKAQKPTAYINKQTGQRELVTPTKYAANPDLYAPLPPVQMFETSEQKEIGKVAGGEFKQLSEAASTALGNNQNLDLMKEIVNLPNLKTGFAGELRTSFAGLAKEFGINTPIQDLTAAETLAGISCKLVLDGLSNFKGAISKLNEAIDITDTISKALFLRGKCYQSKNLFEKAEKDYSKVIDIEGKESVAYQNRAVNYLRQDERVDFKDDIDHYISYHKNDVNALKIRADHYVLGEDYENAISDFTTLINLQPNNANFYFSRTVY